MIHVPEEIIERDIEWAIAAARRADGNIWVAGYFSHRVWKTYEVDATETIARAAGRRSRTVLNWIHAYEMYRQLRTQFRTYEVHALRLALTPSHFWKAWSLQRKYNLTDKDILFHLEQMLNYKKVDESHDDADLEQEIEAEQDDRGNPPSWEHYYMPRLANLFAPILALTDAPQTVKDWLKKAPPEVTG